MINKRKSFILMRTSDIPQILQLSHNLSPHFFLIHQVIIRLLGHFYFNGEANDLLDSVYQVLEG